MSLSGFTDPWWLLLIGVVAVLAAGYLVIQRLRRRDTKRFTNLELLAKVALGVPAGSATCRRPCWPSA